MTKPITIKTALTAEEVRAVADYFLEFWEEGARPAFWSPVYMEALVEKVRQVEKGLA